MCACGHRLHVCVSVCVCLCAYMSVCAHMFVDVCVCVCVCVCVRSEEHTSELQSHLNLVCRLLLEKNTQQLPTPNTLTRRYAHIPTHRHAHTHTKHTSARPLSQPPYTYTPLFSFFFKNTDPPEIHPFPSHAAFRI